MVARLVSVLVSMVAPLAGCGGGSSGDGGGGWYTLVLVPEAGSDPFSDPAAEFLYLAIENGSGEIEAEETFPLDAGEYELDDAPTGNQLWFVVEVQDAAFDAIAEGRSGPHALVSGEHTTVTVILEDA